MYNFIGKKIEGKVKQQIIENFKTQYVNDTYPERILMINHLKSIEKIMPIEKLKDIVMPRYHNIFFYHERQKNLYITNFKDICMYIEQLEPWEDVDCLIFDEKLEWYLGITHSDDLYLTGIGDNNKMKKEVFVNLNWNTSIENQERAINEISSIDDLNPQDLLQPIGKEYWENAAKVLFEMGYPRIEEAIPGLFFWLQDMTWPGAAIVVEILESLPKDIFINYLECAATEAIVTNDEIWLINLSVFLTSFDLDEDDFVSKKVYLALSDVYRKNY